jgi:hypothetical protein
VEVATSGPEGWFSIRFPLRMHPSSVSDGKRSFTRCSSAPETYSALAPSDCRCAVSFIIVRTLLPSAHDPGRCAIRLRL